jgi:hypothetical protein
LVIGCPKQYTVLFRSMNTTDTIDLAIQYNTIDLANREVWPDETGENLGYDNLWWDEDYAVNVCGTRFLLSDTWVL